MSETTPSPGKLGWIDLTVEDAAPLRDFYCEVLGWTAEPLDLGGYADFVMRAADGSATAGVCHARGPNEHLNPGLGQRPSWMPYFQVANLSAAMEACTASGGRVLHGPTGEEGGDRIVVMADPAGTWFSVLGPG